MSRQSSRHFVVSIPRVLLQRSNDDSRKKYFAYEIQITPVSSDSEKWTVLRRYSEFHRMDKYLQMSNPMIKTLDFPPKKSFGNMVSASEPSILHVHIKRWSNRHRLSHERSFFSPWSNRFLYHSRMRILLRCDDSVCKSTYWVCYQ